MAEVDPNIASLIAHMAGVKEAAHNQGREILGVAGALFAPHNHPGRHELEGSTEDTDYLVSLVGPAPLSVEYGRGPSFTKKGRRIGPMVGLHILGRAAGL